MSDEAAETRLLDTQGVLLARLGEGVVLNARYRLDVELGRGGMGVVYRATDLQLDRQVAIKILPEAAGSSQARVRLVEEARAAAALNHPHIVAVHDVGEDRGVPFFVMELVHGTTLRAERIDDTREILAVATQVCDALAHAHAHGIVHRDIKPENILVIGSGAARQVKVADLGVAMPLRAAGTRDSGQVVGTAAYIAPEQALGERIDGRADLYSLGAVLYELVTGRPPFVGDHALAVISQHVNAPVVPPRMFRADLPAGLEAVILKLLAKSPGDRYEGAAAAKAALQESLEGAAPAEPTSSSLAMLDALSRGRMVGRSEELTRSRELWRRAAQGRGHGLLISGEPGVGKTRLARELMIQSGLDGAAVLWGACYEFEAATPHLPFAEALRRWIRGQADEALRDVLGERVLQIAKLAPELEARLGPFPSHVELPAHEERLLFVDAVVALFRALAAPQGLLFYVDDLHWADNATLWLLGHLLRHLSDDRVLVVASYRESELDRTHPLSKALVEWNRERLTTRIALKRLGPKDTHAQLSALLGEDAGAGLATALHRETDGNPFFVEEILKALIEQGAVRREDGRWAHAAVGELQLPQSVKAAIGRRLDRVSPETNDVLRAAAVLGKVFAFNELSEAVSDRNEEALLNALDEAGAAQLLIHGRNETFAFTHDKIREVLYEELNPIRRRRLHLRTAEGLERCQDRCAVSVDRLAHHFIEAGVHEKGLTYGRQAAREAQRMFAYDEALAAYGRALECAEILGRTDEQLAIEEAVGRLCQAAGNTVAALEHFERALAHAPDPVIRARLQCEAATSLVTIGDARGLVYLHEARGVLDPAEHPIETANACIVEGRFHHLGGRHRAAIGLFERAVELLLPRVESAPDGEAATTLVLAYGYLAGAYQHLGLMDEGDRWAHRTVEFGVTHKRPAAEAMGYEFLAENAFNAGRWAEAIAYATTERAIAQRIHSRERHAWTYLPAALAEQALGHAARGDAEAEEGLAIANAIGERRLATLLRAYRPGALADLGRLDEARRLADEAVHAADDLGLLFMQTEARRTLAYVHHVRGEWADAARIYAEILQMMEGREPVITKLLMGPCHIRTLRAAGRHTEAEAQLTAFEQLAAQCQSPFAVSEAARLRS